MGYREGFGRGPARGFGGGTGRGLGRGFGWDLRENEGRGIGRGVGLGYRRPFFLRNDSIPATETYYQETPTKEEETSYLTGLVESLEHELKAIRGRLKELTGKENDK